MQPCVSNPCINNGVCIDRQSYYFCLCLESFTGDRCQSGNVKCNPGRLICKNGVSKVHHFDHEITRRFNGLKHDVVTNRPITELFFYVYNQKRSWVAIKTFLPLCIILNYINFTTLCYKIL